MIRYRWASGTRQVGQVEVTELTPDKVAVHQENRQKPVFIAEHLRQHEPIFSAGASDPEWMKGNPAHTPAGVFGDMLLTSGFATWEYTRDALLAFSKIEGCDWALQMLGSFHPDMLDDPSQAEPPPVFP